MRYLLDTNIVSDLVRNPQGKVATILLRRGIDNACTSIVVAAELRYGAARVNSHVLATGIEKHFQYLHVVPLESPADVAYGAIRADLESRGEQIGPNDLLIAAHAIALGLILVTENESEFSRVKGLTVENWLQ
jgi:tRNA(fMet)-specific endonuclease VapC